LSALTIFTLQNASFTSQNRRINLFSPPLSVYLYHVCVFLTPLNTNLSNETILVIFVTSKSKPLSLKIYLTTYGTPRKHKYPLYEYNTNMFKVSFKFCFYDGIALFL